MKDEFEIFLKLFQKRKIIYCAWISSTHFLSTFLLLSIFWAIEIFAIGNFHMRICFVEIFTHRSFILSFDLMLSRSCVWTLFGYRTQWYNRACNIFNRIWYCWCWCFRRWDLIPQIRLPNYLFSLNNSWFSWCVQRPIKV